MKQFVLITLILIFITIPILTGCIEKAPPVVADTDEVTDKPTNAPTEKPVETIAKPTLEPTEKPIETPTPEPTVIPVDSNIPKEWVTDINSNIVHVLLMGLDGGGSTTNRTDAMMLLQIDRAKKELRLVSFMRDMWVDVPGGEPGKLNSVNVVGGPGLLVYALNSNFDLNIQYYVSINFKSFQRLINALGGVGVSISGNEVGVMQDMYYDIEIEGYSGRTPADITGSGYYTLNGNQALNYVRMRSGVGGDFGRIRRQRKLITNLWNKYRKYKVLSLTGVVGTTFRNVKTNLQINQILTLAGEMVLAEAEIYDMGIPLKDAYKAQTIHGQAALVIDWDKNKEALNKFLKGELDD